jgi:hypothetical protein
MMIVSFLSFMAPSERSHRYLLMMASKSGFRAGALNRRMNIVRILGLTGTRRGASLIT